MFSTLYIYYTLIPNSSQKEILESRDITKPGNAPLNKNGYKIIFSVFSSVCGTEITVRTKCGSNHIGCVFWHLQ